MRADVFPEGRLALSILEAAKTLGVSEWTVKDLLRQGLLKGRKAGSRTLVEAAGLKAYWDALPAAQYAPPVDRPVARRTLASA
jgi:excisionase family DNA binding protein